MLVPSGTQGITVLERMKRDAVRKSSKDLAIEQGREDIFQMNMAERRIAERRAFHDLGQVQRRADRNRGAEPGAAETLEGHPLPLEAKGRM